MILEETCPACGDPEHAGLCKQALSVIVADQRVETDEQQRTIDSLTIQVAALADEVHSLTAEVHQWR